MKRLSAAVRRYLTEQSVYRGVLYLFAGNATAQAISLLAYPVLTRLYTPAEIGVLGFFTAISASLQVIASLRYDLAVTIADSDEEAGNLVAVGFIAILFTSLCAVVIVFLLPASVEQHFSAVTPYLMFIPLIMLCAGANAVLANEATRLRRFKDLMRMRFSQAIVGPLLQIVLGWAGLGPVGLLLGFLSSLASGTVGLVTRLLVGPASPLRHVTFVGIRAAAFRHRHFPLFSVFAALVGGIANNLLILAFTLLYGPEIGGFLFLGDRVIGRPLLLITLSMAPVMLAESATLRRERPQALRGFLLEQTKKQILIGALWVGAIAITAPYIVPVVFGAKWSSSVIYLEYLAIGRVVSVAVGTLMPVLQAIAKQGLTLALVSVRLCVMGGVLLAAYELGFGPPLAVLACALADTVTQVASLLVVYRAVAQVARYPVAEASPARS
ncbi:MAG TPA: oligosaccharide flippase family protein [Stellaceae bacterium]|nr:oligosaccharide flippase family protein [Stellaceae bacterium]